jgi:hypothetical protein
MATYRETLLSSETSLAQTLLGANATRVGQQRLGPAHLQCPKAIPQSPTHRVACHPVDGGVVLDQVVWSRHHIMQESQRPGQFRVEQRGRRIDVLEVHPDSYGVFRSPLPASLQ